MTTSLTEVFKALQLFDLESSWVESVVATPGQLTIQGEFVLMAEHPEFVWPPLRPDSMFSTRQVTLVFSEVRHITWDYDGSPPTPNLDGPPDWDGFAELFLDDQNNIVTMSGDWGMITVNCGGGSISLQPMG